MLEPHFSLSVVDPHPSLQAAGSWEAIGQARGTAPGAQEALTDRNWREGKVMGCRMQQTWVPVPLCLLAVGFQASHLTSLSLGFLVSKMGSYTVKFKRALW